MTVLYIIGSILMVLIVIGNVITIGVKVWKNEAAEAAGSFVALLFNIFITFLMIAAVP